MSDRSKSLILKQHKQAHRKSMMIQDSRGTVYSVSPGLPTLRMSPKGNKKGA